MYYLWGSMGTSGGEWEAYQQPTRPTQPSLLRRPFVTFLETG